MAKDWRTTGTISTEGKGYRAYAYQLQMNGVTKRVSKRSVDKQVCLGFIEQVKAENIAIEKQINKKRQGNLEAPPLNFTELFRAYSRARREQQANTGKPKLETLKSENGMIRTRILPVLGDVRLANPNLDDEIINFHRKLRAVTSEKTGHKLSESRKRKIILILKGCLQWSAREEYTSEKLLQYIDLPSQELGNPREMVLDRKDIVKLTSYLKQEKCRHEDGICCLRWLIALGTGRRASEVLGMSWNDVYLTDKVPYFKVTQQLVRRNWIHGCGKSVKLTDDRWGHPCEIEAPVESRYCPQKHSGGLYVESGTKGGKNIQPEITLDDHLLNSFIEHKRVQQKEVRSALEDETADLPIYKRLSDLVFLQPVTLRPYGHRHDTDLWEKICENAKLSQRYTPHQLRHTAATRLMEVPEIGITGVAQILGHKSIQTTQRYIKHDRHALKGGISTYMDSLMGESDTDKP
ncbi:tyrosine-type recombinase/integrase [Glutamicibacter ardleyensis]|uniref:tyrosine-type recombinase/integrase n=1 Tax=Glutamicibacter ardleyensis TaxID=225894 RepID=UPI003FD1C17B